MKSLKVRLGHGSGGRLTQELIREGFGALVQGELARADDSGFLRVEGLHLALTTDTFTVRPLFFPGGDIGKLAITGTVNDLAVSGAKPLALTAGFVLEEGLPVEDLRKISQSMARAASEAGVQLIAADTKVVEGSGGLFVNTSGLGLVLCELSPQKIEPGDRILVTGTLGDHEFAVLLAREDLGLEASFPSDCAPLWGLLEPLYRELGPSVKFVRDPTRGGLATVLNEVVREGLEFRIWEERVPLRPEVQAAAEILGLDPLYAASEGRAVLFVAPEAEERALEILRTHPLGKDAQVIGEVREGDGLVILETPGGERVLDLLAESQYPRIC